MRLRVTDHREFLAGLLFLVIGFGWAVASLDYPVGQATNMGSGYFPLCVSLLLALFGLTSLVRSLAGAANEDSLSWDVVPLVFVFAGVLLFAALVERAGLIPATIGLVVLSSYKRIWQKPIETLLLTLVTAVFVAILFVYVLQLDMKLFWA